MLNRNLIAKRHAFKPSASDAARVHGRSGKEHTMEEIQMSEFAACELSPLSVHDNRIVQFGRDNQGRFMAVSPRPLSGLRRFVGFVHRPDGKYKTWERVFLTPEGWAGLAPACIDEVPDEFVESVRLALWRRDRQRCGHCGRELEGGAK